MAWGWVAVHQRVSPQVISRGLRSCGKLGDAVGSCGKLRAVREALGYYEMLREALWTRTKCFERWSGLGYARLCGVLCGALML